MSNNNIRILSQPISYQELKSIHGLKITGIYKIENTVNHKVYIGKSVNVIERLKEHTYNEDNKHLRNAFKKYGLDKFSFEVIKQTYDLNYWEIFLIQIYRATDNRYGYNIATGGEGGYLGEEWRQRIIAASRQYWSSPEAESTKMHLREKALAQLPRTKEQEEQRLKNLASFWNSPDGLAKKKKLSQKQIGVHNTKGMHWYNNGIKNILCFECPEGFVLGRLGDFSQSKEANQKRSDWYNNLTDEQRKEYKQRISNSHKGKHFTAERKKHIGDGNRGRKYYNNGVIEVMQFECPEGFVPGRCPKSKQAISKGTKKH